jgi:N-acetylmuramoyl-L-alanine amidase
MSKPTCNKEIICIDAGHGGVQPGAVSPQFGYKEKDIALDISLKVRDYLLYASKDGDKYIIHDFCDKSSIPLVDVIMTRSGDIDISLKERCVFANKAKATFFISIHCNSHKTSEPNGIETWYYSSSSPIPKKLAENIQKNMMENVKDYQVENHPIKSRGVKSTTTYYTLKHTVMPSIVVECGFMSNTDEVKLLYENEAYRVAIAKGIAKGILESL